MSSSEEICRSIYAETAEFYGEIRPRMGNSAFGFKILYGPPIIKPPVLFMGYQPGGSAEDDKEKQERWPEIIEYATEEWTLAKHMRSMFCPEKLKGCVGLNAIFFRAPRIETWKAIPRELRCKIEEFCVPRVVRMIDAIQPNLIVAIGFEALYLFGPAKPDLVNQSGRVITRSGLIARYPAISTLHLSGAHISTADRNQIAERVRRMGWPMSLKG